MKKGKKKNGKKRNRDSSILALKSSAHKQRNKGEGRRGNGKKKFKITRSTTRFQSRLLHLSYLLGKSESSGRFSPAEKDKKGERKEGGGED